jgi:hypothetical protein
MLMAMVMYVSTIVHNIRFVHEWAHPPDDLDSSSLPIRFSPIHAFLIVTSLAFMLPVFLGIASLCSYQTGLIMDNTTSIEVFEKLAEKRDHRDRGLRHYRWLYNLGTLANVRQVLGRRFAHWLFPIDVFHDYLPHDRPLGTVFPQYVDNVGQVEFV